jgi:glutathione S-transferase
MKLYVMPPSGNSYKVRILLSLLNVPYETVVVDYARNEHKRPEFLKLNPRGEVPVLEDAGTVIWDSAACLVYLARKYGGDEWLPLAPSPMAEVMQWIALASTEIQCGLQYARRGILQNRWNLGNLEESQAFGRVALASMENRLGNNDWLAGRHPTVADIACFPYVETAPEARIPLGPYPGVTAWLARCKALPGWAAREMKT